MKVPVGVGAENWTTVGVEATVLLVAHNLTTLNRLLDVADLFDGDFGVQVIITSSLSDPFVYGLPAAMVATGLLVMPWESASETAFDLIVAASHHGNLTDLRGPIVVLSHGIGYTKYSPGDAETRRRGDAETRRRGDAETRRRGDAETRRRGDVFGLSRQWLLYDGVAVAAAFVLSHPEQLDRMAATAPEAVPAAALAGDPCFDRMLASRPHRSRYRRVLGVPDGRMAVVVSSTWSSRSLLGTWPGLLRQLVAELPADEYQVIFIVHPNVTQGHGPFQIRSWLAEPLRSGLILVPPEHGWQAALIAADLVVGDHGSVTAYGAALGRPVLLGSFPDDEVAPGTAVHRLGALAPRLDRAAPLRSQVTAVLAGHTSGRYVDVTALTSAFPGEAAGRLRALCYGLLGRAEPLDEPTTRPYDATGLAPGAWPRLSIARVECQVEGSTVRIRRYAPAPVPLGLAAYPGRLHMAAHHAHPGPRAREAATLVFAYADEHWPAGASRCPVTAVLHPASAELNHRDHGRWTIAVDAVDAVDPPDSAALASAALAWLDHGAAPEAAVIDVDLGYRVVPATVTVTL